LIVGNLRARDVLGRDRLQKSAEALCKMHNRVSLYAFSRIDVRLIGAVLLVNDCNGARRAGVQPVVSLARRRNRSYKVVYRKIADTAISVVKNLGRKILVFLNRPSGIVIDPLAQG
jgi:hypothetical protein